MSTKKFFLTAAAILMILVLGAAAAQAAESGTCGANLTWTLDDNGKLTISGTGAMTDYSSGASPFFNNSDIAVVVIDNGVTSVGAYAFANCSGLLEAAFPETLTDIGDQAFRNCRNLNRAVLPNGLKSIGSRAFYSCMGLNSAAVPDSLEKVGESAFNYCSDLTKVYFNGTAAKWGKITIEDNNDAFTDSELCYKISGGVCGGNAAWTLYDDGALFVTGSGDMYNYSSAKPLLSDRGSIASVVVCGNITGIGDTAFANCDNLKEVSIGRNVKTIGNNAFLHCGGIERISLPSELENIGYGAFADCGSLTAVIFENGNAYYEAVDGILFNKRKTELIQYPAGKLSTKYSVPDSVESICDYAFNGCGNLQEITIPDSVVSIGSYAFSGSGLTDVHYLDNKKSWSAISIKSYNNELLNANLHYETSVIDAGSCGDNVTWTFYDDGTLVISGSGRMTDYLSESSLFYGNTGITSLVIENGVTNVGSYAFEGCAGIKNISLAASVKSIDEGAFWECTGITDIDIPSSVTVIEAYAFVSCKALTSVTLPERLTSISAGTFQSCENLTEIIIPDNVQSMGNNAFQLCGKLKTVTLSESLESIGNSAFRSCNSIEVFYYNGTEAQWEEVLVGNNNGIISSRTVTCMDERGSCGDNVSYILYDNGELFLSGSGATSDHTYYYRMSPFQSKIKIKKVIVKEGITKLGEDLFYGCYGMKSIELPQSLTSIGDSAFHGCSGLESIAFPDNLTSIGAFAFDGCSSIDSIDIPDGVTTIEQYTFYDCGNAKSINIPDSVTKIEKYAFQSCGSVTHVTIPQGITSVSEGVFSNCGSLTEVDIPSSVTYIGYHAFERCDSLTEVTVPETVNGIGEHAFEKCGSLKSINIPQGVVSIQYSCFYSCGNLKDIYYSGTADNWSNVSIGRYNDPFKAATIHYVSGSGKCGKALQWVLYDDGKLIVTGSGEMYEDISDNSPFYQNIDINNVTIAYGVSNISNGFLDGCRNVQNVTINHTVSDIGAAAFRGCASLRAVSIPEGAADIKSSTFYNCAELKTVSIPISVKTIETNAFYGCTNLNEIHYLGGSGSWNSISVSSGNDRLKKATLYLDGTDPVIEPTPEVKPTVIPIIEPTTISVEKSSTDTAWIFKVTVGKAYENSYVYAAIYDESNTITSINRTPLKLFGSTEVEVNKPLNGKTAKIFVWTENLQPTTNVKEMLLQ